MATRCCWPPDREALETAVEDLHHAVGPHDAVDDVGLADEVGHKGVLRLVINVLRGADLLDLSLVHDHHSVGHGQGLLLVVGDVDEGDAHGLLDALEFDLHILAQTQIQRAQRLVQQKDLGPVHQSTGDGDPLLLAAGQRGDRPLLKALQVDHLQHLQHPLLDLRLRKLDLPAALWVGLWDPKAKGDVFKYIQVGEKGVPLEHGVDGPLMGRNIIDPHAVKKNVPLCGRLKTANDTKCGGFAAPTGTQQREEFLIVDV